MPRIGAIIEAQSREFPETEQRIKQNVDSTARPTGFQSGKRNAKGNSTISMPFKILLFVLADGWNLIIMGTVGTFYR